MPTATGVPGARECTQYVVNNFKFENVLDLGCGFCPYLNTFTGKGIKYTGIDSFNPQVLKKISAQKNVELINANFMAHNFGDRKFDCVYSSHVIEHVADTEAYIRKLKGLVKEGGIMCIIWPKPKPEVVGGHVHIFNPGMMYYNVTRTGINCSQWKCVEKDYSFCIAGPCHKVPQPKLTYSAGEIETLNPLFPFKATQGFHGVNGVPTVHL